MTRDPNRAGEVPGDDGLELRRLSATLAARNRQIAAVHSISRLLSSSLDLEDRLRDILTVSLAAVGAVHRHARPLGAFPGDAHVDGDRGTGDEFDLRPGGHERRKAVAPLERVLAVPGGDPPCTARTVREGPEAQPPGASRAASGTARARPRAKRESGTSD